MSAVSSRSVRRVSLGLGLYVQAIYPAIIVAAARARRRSGSAADVGPAKVTVLIAAWNEAEVIEKKLRNTLESDYPAELLEVVVATDGSTDSTPEIVATFPDRRVVLSHTDLRDGKIGAINRAFPIASGDVIVFSDANNLYRRETIRLLVERFADPRVGAVSGAKVTTSGPAELELGESLYWRYESAIKTSEDRLASCTSASGEVLAVRRDLVEPLPADATLDDFIRILQVLKRGYHVGFVADAISFEPTAASLADERQRRMTITAGRWHLLAHPDLFPLRRPIVMWQILSHKVGRLLLPLFALVALASNVVEVLGIVRGRERGRGQRREAVAVLSAQVLFYVAALAAPHLRLGGRVGKAARLPQYLVSTNAASLAGLASVLRGDNRRVRDKVSRHDAGSDQGQRSSG
jgi:cellulose synthase/poly-beta-1,6-N-acetylglucosamine synthase-like glycosyltransferase